MLLDAEKQQLWVESNTYDATVLFGVGLHVQQGDVSLWRTCLYIYGAHFYVYMGHMFMYLWRTCSF